MCSYRTAQPEPPSTLARPEPRSDIPTLLSATNPTLVRHSDTSDSPTVRQSDSCPTAVRHSFSLPRPAYSVKQCQTVKHNVRQSDIPTFRHCPTVSYSKRSSLRNQPLETQHWIWGWIVGNQPQFLVFTTTDRIKTLRNWLAGSEAAVSNTQSLTVPMNTYASEYACIRVGLNIHELKGILHEVNMIEYTALSLLEFE